PAGSLIQGVGAVEQGTGQERLEQGDQVGRGRDQRSASGRRPALGARWARRRAVPGGPRRAHILAGVKKVWFYLLIGLAVAALGVAAYSLGVLLRPAPELRGTELITPAGVGDLTLEDAEGRNVTLGDYRD